MRESLISIVVLAVLMLGGKYLLRRGRQGRAPGHVARTGGPLVLRQPRRNGIMLGITALIPAGLLAALTLYWWRLGQTGTVGLVTGMVAAVLVLAFAAYQFAHAFRARLVVHDTGIERIGVSRRRLVGWGSISKIAFNPAQHWFFVTVSDGSHLWLPADVTGMPEFAQIAVRRIPAAVLRADPAVREVLDELATAAEGVPSDAG